MFDGDQFHQFIASSRSSLPIPLSFSLHGNPSFSTAFDPFPPSSEVLHTHLHHQEPPPSPPTTTTTKKYPLISTNLALESERSMDPWSNDEVLALLKVRSSMEIWFPDFTWEHVSRKLSELGYQRSREECKEKLEEESRHLERGNFRVDEIYEDDEAGVGCAKSSGTELININMDKEEKEKEKSSEQQVVVKVKKRRRSKDHKFEMLKGFCESVVKKLMAQQEEMQKKLLEEIVKRDDEKIAREEAWKNQEMKRMRMEIEMRSKEQASAEKRQATIIEFLNKYTSSSSSSQHLINNNSSTTCSKTPIHDGEKAVENPISTVVDHHQQSQSPSSSKQASYLLSSSSDHHQQQQHQPPSGAGEIGKRWPRDEVVALINLRCKMSNMNGEDQSSKMDTKGPLWERISQGMMELGYKRSAKRCKEKWENINKYFRKTKDSSKKRSVNSRTCPYFHQLSCLYSQGPFHVAPNNLQENHHL